MKNESEIKVPFLLCIPVEKRGNVIEKLGEYQQQTYNQGLDLNLRAQFPEIPLPEIPTEEMTEQEIENEISKAPSHQARVK